MQPAFHRLIWLMSMCVVLLTFAGGCRAVETKPTPTPAPNASEVKATTDAMVEAIDAAYPLAATAWDLEYFGPPEVKQPILPDTRASVYYLWDRYAGFDGCNWFLGMYKADQEGSLQMFTPARTRVLCESEELQEQSIYYSGNLLSAGTYVTEEGQLLVNTADNQRLLTHNAAQPMPMLGTEWELKLWWWTEGKMWNPVLPESSTTIKFGLDGEASGFGGCNSYTVPVEGDLQIEKVMQATDTYAELPTLRFGAISARMTACEEPGGIMDQEQSYFVALNSTAYYFKLGGMVMFLDAKGTPLVLLAANS